MERTTTTVCSYRKCKNSYKKKKDLRMFRFPKHLSQEWVRSCGNINLIGLSPSRLYKNKKICEEHFRKEDILPSGRLVRNAIPLQYSASECSTPSCASTRENTGDSVQEPNESVNRLVHRGRMQTYENRRAIEPRASPDVSTSSSKFTVQQSPSVRNWIDQASPTNRPDRTRLVRLKRSLFSNLTPTRKFESKYKQCRRKLASKTSELSRLKKRFIDSRKRTWLLKTNMFKTRDAAVLCNMQLHKNRQSWSKEERKLSTALYLKSPSTYKFLRQRIVLPGQSTIQRWLGSNELFRPGFNSTVLGQIQIKASTMTSMERDVVLMFDEMYIKKGLEYSRKYDFIEGFQDTGRLNRGPEIAKQAAVFMVRGLYYHWKLPVAYFVTERGLAAGEIKDLILQAVDYLQKADLNVKAVVCDQCSSNVSAYQKLHITENKPFFLNSKGEKIFALYDSPHLLKSLRNNLITHDFILDGKQISFSDIRELYKIETSSGTTRAAHQLSAAHIWPNSFQKLSVSLAAQVFSHTTSAALKTAVATGEIRSSTASNTADFISDINNLFDALNSKKRKTPNPATCALNKNDPYIRDVLEGGMKIFKSLKKIKSTHPEPPCFRGFRLTIQAILQLFEYEDCQFLLTSRLNQDPLENLFSSIRQRGGFNKNPTVRVFRGSIRISTLKQLMEPPKSTSYDPDLDELLEIGNAVVNEGEAVQGNPSIMSEESNIDASSADSFDSRDEGPALIENNIVTLEKCSQVYFTGYLAHCYYKKFKCNDCLKKMCDVDSELKNKRELLLLNRSFSNVKIDISSGLFSPSESLQYVVDPCLKLYKKRFHKIGHKLHLVKRLVRLSKSMVSLDSLTCSNCIGREDFILYHMFRVLIHKQCKWISTEFKTSALSKVKVLSNV